MRLAVPAKVEPVAVDGQSAFGQAYGVQWTPGPFRRTFPELDRTTKNFQTLSFEQLFVVLEAEASRTSESVEVFGAKIPSTEVFHWGVPAILVVQLYLLLHLRALVSVPGVATQAEQVAWIGVYKGFLPRSATWLSAFAFPVASIVVLTSSHLHASLSVNTLLSIAAIMASVTMASFSWHAWRTFRQLLDINIKNIPSNPADSAAILQ